MLPTRLNVLLPEKRRNLQRMIRNEFIKSGLSAIIVVVSIIGVAFLGGRYVLETYFSQLGDNLLALNIQAQERNIQVRTVNNRVEEAARLFQVYRYWPDTIQVFSEIVPTDVYLNSLQIDMMTKQATVVGIAATRESLISYGAALRALDIVAEAEVPIAALAKPLDIEFTITMKLR